MVPISPKSVGTGTPRTPINYSYAAVHRKIEVFEVQSTESVRVFSKTTAPAQSNVVLWSVSAYL